MGVLRHHRRLSSSSSSSATALVLLFFAFAAITSHSASSPIRQLGGEVKEEREEARARKESHWLQGWERVVELTRRKLTGPGSSPPSCRSKCGRCSPCKPVHIPIQPGQSTPLEYYPEAWRCKCGNKFFMP